MGKLQGSSKRLKPYDEFAENPWGIICNMYFGGFSSPRTRRAYLSIHYDSTANREKYGMSIEKWQKTRKAEVTAVA